VTCGIKAEIGKAPPKPMSHIAVNIELMTLCSPQFRRGVPSSLAQSICEELNSLTCNLIPPSNFRISTEEEELFWYLYVDLYCLDYNGNIFDASMIAVLSALKSLKLPTISMKGGVVSATENRTNALQLHHYPVPLTFGIFDSFIITDPTADEEKLGNGSFSIVFDEKGQLYSVVKSGGSVVTDEQLRDCMEQAKLRAKVVYNEIHKDCSQKTT